MYKTITLYIVRSNFHVHKLIHEHFFFFLISNIRIIIDEGKKKKHTMCSWEWTQQSTKQNTKESNQETKLREEKNWTIEEHFAKPQHLDQSKRLL